MAEGLSQGFSIPFQQRHKHRFATNLKLWGEWRRMEIVAAKLHKEKDLRRISGPCLGEYRVILHLSYLHGDSVNDAIDPTICSIRYAPLNSTVDMIQALGPTALMAKCNIKSTFSG